MSSRFGRRFRTPLCKRDLRSLADVLHAKPLEERPLPRLCEVSVAGTEPIITYSSFEIQVSALPRYRAHAHDATRTNERGAYAMTCISRSEQVLPRYGERWIFFFVCVSNVGQSGYV